MDEFDFATDVVGILSLTAIAIWTGLDPAHVVSAVLGLAGVRAGKEGGQ